MNRLAPVLTLLLVVALACPALADKTVTVEAIDPSSIVLPITPEPLAPEQICTVGNLNALSFAIVGFVLPPEEYALVFSPSAGCPDCAFGVEVETIHVQLRTSVACELVVQMGVRQAITTNPACPTPGPPLCGSELFTVSIPGGGIWDISLPVDCVCLDPAGTYLLSFELVSSSCLPEPDLITDALPTICTSYNNFGSGWIDLVSTFGFPGNLSFFAGARCCTPVATEEATWGSIKEQYEE